MLFAQVAASGNAMLFILLLCVCASLSIYVLAFTARCLLVVFQGTAIGEDNVTWPDEPMADWIGGSAHLVALILLWVMPIGFLSCALGSVWLERDPALRTLILLVPGFWLLFPIGLLSSASTVSRWAFFRPIIIWNMLRVMPATILFYLATAIIWAWASGMWYGALTTNSIPMIVLASLVGSAGVLIYARLLGRLGWLIHRLPSNGPREVKSDTPRKKKKRKRPLPVQQTQPEPEPLPGPPKKALSPWGKEMEDVESYGVASGPEPAPVEQASRVIPRQEDLYTGHEADPAEDQSPDRDSRPRLRRRRDIAEEQTGPPPALAMWTGIYDYPWRGSAFKNWLWLCCGSIALGITAAAMVSFYPA